jgi:hypothetical protein
VNQRTTVKPWSSSPPVAVHAGATTPPADARRRWGLRLVTIRRMTGVTVFLIALATAFYPKPPKPRAVPASTIRPGAVSGRRCGTFGAVTKAVRVNRIGGVDYFNVTCADGVHFLVAQ